MKAPIEISARHFHCTEEDYRSLFGHEHYHIYKKLSQKGQFASDKIAYLISKSDTKIPIRFLGPFRDKTQVEISKSDAFLLKVDPPVEENITLESGAKGTLSGTHGEISGNFIMVAQRHLHISTSLAKKHNLRDEQLISFEVRGDRELIFEKVIVRVNDSFTLAIHLDTDEANAADLKNGDLVKLIY